MTDRASIHRPGSRVWSAPVWLYAGAALLLVGFGRPRAEERDAGLACSDARELTALLVETTGQRLAGGGRAQSGWRFELYQGGKADVWTLVKVSADGDACIVDMGQGWAMAMPPLVR
jgi:hypothetical protein